MAQKSNDLVKSKITKEGFGGRGFPTSLGEVFNYIIIKYKERR